MIRYQIPLRENLIAALILPRDLTKKEAKRLKAVIDVLVMPEQEIEREDEGHHEALL